MKNIFYSYKQNFFRYLFIFPLLKFLFYLIYFIYFQTYMTSSMQKLGSLNNFLSTQNNIWIFFQISVVCRKSAVTQNLLYTFLHNLCLLYCSIPHFFIPHCFPRKATLALCLAYFKSISYLPQHIVRDLKISLTPTLFLTFANEFFSPFYQAP